MSDIVKFSPAAGGVGFAKAATEFAKNRPTVSGGMALLILQKVDGAWVYGADRTEIEEGSRWVIDPNSVCKGYVAWVAGQPTERMAVIGHPDIDPMDLPSTTAKQGWQEQVGFGLICLDGEDEGERVMYKTNTMGGIEVWNAVFDQMMARAAQGLPYAPIVTLASSSYQHREHGTIWKPIFDIVGWMGDESAGQVEDHTETQPDDDGVIDGEIVEDEPKPAAQSTRRKRRAS